MTLVRLLYLAVRAVRRLPQAVHLLVVQIKAVLQELWLRLSARGRRKLVLAVSIHSWSQIVPR